MDRLSARSKPPVAGDDRRTFHRGRRPLRRQRDARHGAIGDGGHRAAARRDAHVQPEHHRDRDASTRGAHGPGADVGARALRRGGRAARDCLLQRRQHAPGAIGVTPARDRDSRVDGGGTLGDCAIGAGRKPAARRRRRRARLGLARWSLDALPAVAPTNLLGVSELFIDRRVLAYAFGLSLATGAIAGLAPTILFVRRSMADALRTRGSKAGHAPRVRQALVVVQVAMAVVLLCGAGVLVRTLIALDRAPLGFDARDVLTMRVGISPVRYPDERPRDFYREALTRLRALPGVESAAAAASTPLIGLPRGGTRFHELGAPGSLSSRSSRTCSATTTTFAPTSTWPRRSSARPTRPGWSPAPCATTGCGSTTRRSALCTWPTRTGTSRSCHCRPTTTRTSTPTPRWGRWRRSVRRPPGRSSAPDGARCCWRRTPVAPALGRRAGAARGHGSRAPVLARPVRRRHGAAAGDPRGPDRAAERAIPEHIAATQSETKAGSLTWLLAAMGWPASPATSSPTAR